MGGWVGLVVYLGTPSSPMKTAAVTYSGSFLHCSKTGPIILFCLLITNLSKVIHNIIPFRPDPSLAVIHHLFYFKKCHYFLSNYFFFYIIESPDIWTIYLFLFIWNDPSRKQSNQANKVMSGVGKGKYATINTFNVKHRCKRKWFFFVPITCFECINFFL